MNQSEITESRERLREFFASVRRLTTEEQAERVHLLREIAERVREDNAARSIMERLLSIVKINLPDEAATFHAYYLDGQIAQQVSRSLCMDKRTVHRHNSRIFEAMLPVAFGIAGIWEPEA